MEIGGSVGGSASLRDACCVCKPVLCCAVLYCTWSVLVSTPRRGLALSGTPTEGQSARGSSHEGTPGYSRYSRGVPHRGTLTPPEMYMITRGSIKPWALAAGTRRGALSGFSCLGAFFLLSMANSMATSTIEAIAKMRYFKCTVYSLRSRRSLPLGAADNRYNRRYRLQGPAAAHGAGPLQCMALAHLRMALARLFRIRAHGLSL
jgi:hypothetical protein